VPADQAGRLLVTRRAISDVVRAATLGSYGVVGLASSSLGRGLTRLGLTRLGVAQPGIRVRHRDGSLEIELDLVIGHGLPIAEVARQVDAAVRHAVRQALGKEVGSLAIRVQHLRFETGRGRRPDPPAHSPGTPSTGASPTDRDTA